MIARINDPQFALFVDYENVADQEGKHLERILKEVTAEGSVTMLRAYADWSRFGNHRKRLQASGFELIDLPSSNGKNRADIKLAVDVLETAFTKSFVDSFIIVSGDSDFIPLVTKLNELNRRAWLYTTKEVHSPLLAQYCYRVGSCIAQPAVQPKVTTIAKVAVVPNSSTCAVKPSPSRTAGAPTAARSTHKSAKKPLPAKTDATAAFNPRFTDELYGCVYWVIQAMDQAHSGPHRLQHLTSNLRALDPAVDVYTVMGFTKRCSIRFAEQLQSRGFLKIEFRRCENAHYISLTASGIAKFAGAHVPSWFDEISQVHRKRFSRPHLTVASPIVDHLPLTASGSPVKSERAAYQLSLF